MSADSQVFETACEVLETASGLTRLEARGTLRLALKEAGLESRTVTAYEMETVVRKVLPAALEARAVPAGDVCETLIRALHGLAKGDSAGASPAEIFRHLGGDGST